MTEWKSDVRRLAIFEAVCISLVLVIWALGKYSPKVTDWMVYSLMRVIPALVLLALAMPVLMACKWLIQFALNRLGRSAKRLRELAQQK